MKPGSKGSIDKGFRKLRKKNQNNKLFDGIRKQCIILKHTLNIWRIT